MKIGTKLIHNGNEIDKHTGALSIPIYQVSTFHQSDIDNPGEFNYSRSENPTRKALEETIAKLEGGFRGFAFSSGMAATSSVLSIFSSGDHIVVCEDVYGGTHRITSKFFSRFAVEVTFVNAGDLENIRKNIKENTKAIFLESPSNPLLKITDIRGAVKIAKEHGLLTIIDNTFMSPYLQRPIELGIDIVIHSATKFLGGHSDVVGGLVVVKSEDIAEKVYFVQNGFGAILGPQDSWLLLRGIKTLKVRMDYQQQNALQLAQWLEEQKGVEEVFYPGLENHPGKKLHFSQADGAGAVLSFKTTDLQTAKNFMKKVSIAAVAVSLGGVETIVSYPVQMSHAAIPRAERERLGITDTLIRVSLGLEDIEDLIEDFGKALL
ncbi:trans-sulfuration enzyme family protein [Clostridium formicaceticum]|uniref:cysteine-S-conjugate beta-lyase n=1 Tax=Clostridium formicaceticum TaxID=1497 RepID=A0AAC9WHZ9_9CLOT|nr:aminotransferase class I/II-fold pyridoxal phosphate-dependent enzyme [Clostridium formicaceticum]AOY77673.1 cystathionine gamma-synthase [Clostridium formicaceticum]ARE88260.1 Cystathionine beta-lyase MetC [Clostridium formicaceticum]